MFNIVENPNTKELFLASNCYSGNEFVTTYAFDGTPISQNITGWKVIGDAPCVKAWYNEPGNYSTFFGSMTVAMLDGEKWLKFEMGDNISYLRNWLQDAQAGNIVTIANERAYSCRNVARSKARNL